MTETQFREAAAGTVDLRTLRRTFGSFATGVCIVGARGADGTMVGATVNSFTSLSLDPPLVLVCVGHFMRSHDALVGAPGFAVTVLRHGQEDISRRFATSGGDKFAGIEAREGVAGGLVVEPHLAYFDCTTHESYVSGDHTILIGRIQDFGARESDEPLLYFRGDYGRLEPAI